MSQTRADRGRDRQEPVLITSAEASPKQQLASREKRYAIMMGTRVLCLFAAIATYKISLWLMGVFLVGMVVLPWMAVLVANDRPPLKPSVYQRFRGHPDAGRALEQGGPPRVIDQ